MKFRTLIATFALLIAGLVAAPGAHASTEFAAAARSCTKTSTGKCIKGGQFCPKAKYGTSGYDAAGKRWVCKGDRKHPHWLKP